MKAFIDTNIFIDAYLQRKGFESSASVLKSAAITEPIITDKCIFDIVYIMEEHLSLYAIKQLLLDVLARCTLHPIDEEAIYAALVVDWKDFEDTVQYFAISKIPGMEAIITRNKKDFRHSEIPVYTPEEFLRRINQ